MARQELAARAAAKQQQAPQITPQMAQQELAARQAARVQQPTQQAQAQQQAQPQPSFMQRGLQNLRNTGNEVAGAQEQLAFNPERAGKVAAASALNTAQGLANLISKGVHYGTLGLSPEANMKADYNKALGVGNKQAGDELLAMAPLVAVPEGIPTEGLGALSKLAARAAEGEAYGTSAGGNTGTGAATAAGAELPNLLMSAVKGRHAIPAALLKGTATAEERAANAKAAGNLPVAIGQITGSPGANKLYENIVSEVPFSGVSGQQKQVAQGVQGAAEDLIKKSAPNGESSLDPNEQLAKAWELRTKQAQAAKNEQYNKVDELAKKENHKLELNSFTDRAQEVQSIIADSPLLQADKDLKSFMNKVGAYGEAGTTQVKQNLWEALTGKKPEVKPPSIRDANLAKNSLYNAGDTLSKSAVASDRYMGGIYKELSGKIAEDIRSSIKNTGSPELQEAFQNANQEYRNNYSKFLNKDLRKLFDKSKPSDNLAQRIIKPGKENDTYSNINLVQSLLPQEQRGLLPAAYLSKAKDEYGNVDITKMGNILHGLGPRQFNALFGGSGLKGGAQDYQRLMQMSGKARSQMANPNNGQKVTQWLLGGGLLSHATGPVSAAAIAGSIIGGSKAASHIMSSPKIRDKILAAISNRENGVRSGIKESDLYRQIVSSLPRSVASQQSQEKRK